jgi:phenylalanyl-tRNA synthetase beta chain
LGIVTPPELQLEILDGLGLAPELLTERITCRIPPHRADLRREADLIEEIARLVGYDEIPVGGTVTHHVVPEGRDHRLRRRVGEVMQAAGYDEALTLSFVHDQGAKLFGYEDVVRVDPGVRRTHNALRPTLACNLLRACKVNQDASATEVDLWEMAAVFPPGKDDTLTDEHWELAMVSHGDIRDLRGAAEALVNELAPQAMLAVAPGWVEGLAEGAAAALTLDDQPLGAVGRISPDVQSYYGLEKPVAIGWVKLEVLSGAAELKRAYEPIAKYPPVQRDLSLVVDESLTWSELAEALERVDQPLREALEYVTTYRGKPLEKGKKSVTITLTYRSPDGTLRSEDVDEQVEQIIAAAKERFSAELRG